MKRNMKQKDIDRMLRETPAPEFENEQHQRVLRAQLLEQYRPAEADEPAEPVAKKETWMRRWGVPPMGVVATLLIAAIGIIILGHTLNLVLCIMSAVVHGLRLNCIEFFKWALPDEGYLYEAFAKKARQT